MLKSDQAYNESHQQGTNYDHHTNLDFVRNTEHQMNVIKTRSLQLLFVNTICKPVFTGVPMKGEDCRPLMVALVDACSGTVVTSGPEASATVEIVALESDANWIPEEFKDKIVTNDGDKRLFTGEVVLDLNEGVGFVGIIRFSHTKVWKKKRAYRLGVVAKDDYIGTRIREGFTESFFVKDRRLDLHKKHNPPTLASEVWRLNGISKDGAFHQRLSDDKVNINTVQDFLKKLNTDPQKLRDILGEGMSGKLWKVVMDHAQTCVLDERLHVYSSPWSQQKTSVVFDVVGQIKGLLSGFEYISFEMLSEPGKAHSMDLVASAFQQWEGVVSFDNGASLFDKYLQPSNADYHLKSPIATSSSGSKILIPQISDEFDLPQPAISFDDKTTESLNGNKITFSPEFDEFIWPRESPIGDTSILFSQINDELEYPQPAFSFNDYDNIFETSNIICPLQSPNQVICSGSEIPNSREIDEFGFPEPAWDSVWNMDYYNDVSWNWWS